MSVWPTAGIGLVAGCAMELVNGLLVSPARLPPFVATLGMVSIARGAAFTRTRNDAGGRP